MSRKRYFAFRTLEMVFLLWVILTFLFFFFRLLPGEFTDFMLRQGASPEVVAAVKEKWGLNDPLHIQYLRYLQNFITLDAGTSLIHQIPVTTYTADKIFNSFILVGPGITMGYILGSIFGTILGANRGTDLERYGVILLVFIGTIPIFFAGILMIIFFSSYLGWFPTSGMVSPDTYRQYIDAPWWRVYLTKDFAIHYILPFSTIVIRYTYFPSLIMRTSVVEVMGQGFSYYHRITGLSKFKRLRHIAKHASLPVITVYPVSMARGVGGLVLIEFVFNWPGIGSALISAVGFRDFPVMQFIFFLTAAFVIVGNFLVDIIYSVVDPRVSVEGEES